MKTLSFMFLLFLFGLTVSTFAEQKMPPTEEQLKEISERGRALAEYSIAFSSVTKEIEKFPKQPLSFFRCVGKKTDGLFKFACGALDEKKSKLLVSFEVEQDPKTLKFQAIHYNPPNEDTGYFFTAALALQTVYKSQGWFEVKKSHGGSQTTQRYNQIFRLAWYVLPAPEGNFFVYYLRVGTTPTTLIHGMDIRYLISNNGKKILETRTLHKNFYQYDPEAREKAIDEVKIEPGQHTTLTDNIPEDTDVYLVLTRSVKVPEIIATKKFVYKIELDGTIRYLGTFKDLIGDEKKTYKPIL